MKSRITSLGLFSVMLVLTGAALAMADKITLKDGTVLEGTVIKSASGYWFKGADGQRRQIDDAEVASFEKTSGTVSSSGMPGSVPHAMGSVDSVRVRAEQVTTPIAAVSIWQEYIDSKPSPDDLKVAKQELEKWKTLQAEHAQKIKGRWVGGEELQSVLREWKALHEEGMRLMHENQTLAAMKKFEASQAIYPNSFPDAFSLGYLAMLQHDHIKATHYLDQALRLRPNSPEALANLGIVQIVEKHDVREIQAGVMTIYRAAQNGDTKEIAEDLLTGLAYLPEVQKKNDRVKQAVDASNLLAAKYHLSGPSRQFVIVPLHEEGPSETEAEKAIPGTYYSGTGFIISEQGLILTNRHVVKGAKTMLVQLNGRGEKSGTVVKIDDEQDLALVKVNADSPLPFVTLSPADSPNEGAECTVMGFPLIDRFGPGVKITRGIVTSNTRSDEHPGFEYDVMVDAKVNPGNSGGPILDKYGNVMAIVSMKSQSSAMADSFGLGIGAGQIRKFFKKNHVVVPLGLTGPVTLSTEDIVAKVKPATVCILSTK